MAKKRKLGVDKLKQAYIDGVKLSISDLKRLADHVFGYYIRNCEPACVTCGSKNNPQCGHFEKRVHMFTRYDERNCHRQCMRCNVFLDGNYPEYVQFMLKTYGAEELQEIHKLAKQLGWTRQDYELVINKYM